VIAAATLISSCRREEKPSAAARPTPVPLPSVRFEERAQEVGVGFVHVNGAAGKKWMPETMGGGVAIVDFD
jgi:hypothetical protein